MGFWCSRSAQLSSRAWTVRVSEVGSVQWSALCRYDPSSSSLVMTTFVT